MEADDTAAVSGTAKAGQSAAGATAAAAAAAAETAVAQSPDSAASIATSEAAAAAAATEASAAGADTPDAPKPKKKKVVKKVVVRKKKSASKDLREATPDPSVANSQPPVSCTDTGGAQPSTEPPARRPTAAEAADDIRQKIAESVQTREALQRTQQECRQTAEAAVLPAYTCQPADWKLTSQHADRSRLQVHAACTMRCTPTKRTDHKAIY